MNLMSFMPYFWIALVVFAVVGEAISQHMVVLCFMPGAVAALVLSLCSAPLWSCCALFAAISAVMLLLRFTAFRSRYNKSDELEAHPESLCGEHAVVVEPIDGDGGVGRVKIHGVVWSACAYDGKSVFKTGDTVLLSEYSVDRFLCSAL